MNIAKELCYSWKRQ